MMWSHERIRVCGLAVVWVLAGGVTVWAQLPSQQRMWNWSFDSGYPQFWNWDQNWSPLGVPVDGDSVYVDSRCSYRNTFPLPLLTGLTVSGFSPTPVFVLETTEAVDSDGNLIPITHNLFVGSVSVGASTRGSYGLIRHTGSELLTDHLQIDSHNTSWNAKYELSGTGVIDDLVSSNTVLQLDIGETGRGEFEQTGGELIARNITLGSDPGSFGQFTMSGGYAFGRYLDVSGYGQGTVRVTGGTLDVGERAQIGVNESGTMYIYGTGVVTGIDGYFLVGVDGQGAIRQWGDTLVDVNSLTVGYTEEGSYELTDGRLEVVSLRIGHYAPGEMIQRDGVLICYGFGGMNVGYRPEDAGRFEWRDGLVAALIEVGEGSTFALGRDWILGDFNSGIDQDFQGSLNVLGTFEISNGATAQADARTPFFEAGEIQVGAMYETGRLNLVQGSVKVKEALRIASGSMGVGGGELRSLIAGTTIGDDYGRVYPMGTAAPIAELGGTVNFSFFQGFAPQARDTFDIMTGFSQIIDEFDRIVIEGLGGGFRYQVDYVLGRVRLTALNDAVAQDARIEELDVPPDSGSFVELGGGSMQKRGVDLMFTDPFGGHMKAWLGVAALEDMGGLPSIPPQIIGNMQLLQFWDIQYDGEIMDLADLTFSYDSELLKGTPESTLRIYKFSSTSGQWEMLETLWHDPLLNTLSVQTDSFSTFLLGVVPQARTLILVY